MFCEYEFFPEGPASQSEMSACTAQPELGQLCHSPSPEAQGGIVEEAGERLGEPEVVKGWDKATFLTRWTHSSYGYLLDHTRSRSQSALQRDAGGPLPTPS